MDSNLTPKQLRFVELERQKVSYKKFLAELEEATKDVAEEVGIRGHFVDSQGVVYQIVIPNGEFQYFKHIGYVRTKREGEAKGSLSKTAAEELGYK